MTATINTMMRLVSLIGIVLVISGCSWFSWLPWVDDADEEDKSDEPAELIKFDHEVKLERVWKGNVGEGLGKKYLRLTPAIVADQIVATDGYGYVESRDRFSGKRIWRTHVDPIQKGFFGSLNFFDRSDPSFVGGGVGVGEGMAFIGTTEGEVVALDIGSGEIRWRASLGTEILATPAADDGLVFTQTIDGRLVAMEVEQGEVQWAYDNQVPVLTLRGTSSPVIENGIVYAGFANGKIIAFRGTNGEPIWEHRVVLPEGRSELQRMVDVDSRAIVAQNQVFVAAYHGLVKSLSKRDGSPRWEQEISTYLDMAYGYGQVYVIDEEDIISAIDENTGEVMWTQEAFRLRQLSAPIAFSNYVVFGDNEGYVHVLAQRDGRLMGRRKVDGQGVRSSMIVAESTVFVLGNSGSLQALDIERR